VKKMKKILIPGLVSGLVMLVVGMMVNQAVNLFLPGLQIEYQNSNLFRPWSDPLMSLYFLHPFVLGLILAWLWEKTKSLVKEKADWKRGAKFGLAYWLVTLPGMLISYNSFPVSLAMIFSWTASGFFQLIFGGMALAKMDK